MILQVSVTAADNLYRLASVYLNDATQWGRIADQNGLTDPMNIVASGTTAVILIPQSDPTQTGGVPPT